MNNLFFSYIYYLHNKYIMTTAHDYIFDKLSRIGDDKCGQSEKDIQNSHFGTYTTQNYFSHYCGMKQPISFATQQPNINYKGGIDSNVGAGGCNVGTDSDLKISTIQNRPKCRISLQQRDYLTVPYLGKGPHNPDLETKLQQAGYSGCKKDCKQLTEVSHNNHLVDLVPSLKETIQNPHNLIEDVASNGWIRGGIPSRDLSRDKDYFNKN